MMKPVKYKPITFLVCLLLLSARIAFGFSPSNELVGRRSSGVRTTTKSNQNSSPLPSNTSLRKRFLIRLFASAPDKTDDDDEVLFFVRRALMADVARASQILADGFFKHKTNFFMYQWEKLETFLSLESTFPKPNTLHQLFVACDIKTGRVLGMAEVDARGAIMRSSSSSKGKTSNENTKQVRDASINGPYMCNVAVDERYQRQGIATALIRQCEEQVQEWYRLTEGSISCSLYLKVRVSNQAATQMYSKLDYMNFRQEQNPKTGETIVVMRKELPRPKEKLAVVAADNQPEESKEERCELMVASGDKRVLFSASPSSFSVAS